MYKRQVGEDNSNVYDTVYCDSDEQRAFELTTQLLNEHPDITVPVSYTHLDVYKRQGYSCPENIFHRPDSDKN